MSYVTLSTGVTGRFEQGVFISDTGWRWTTDELEILNIEWKEELETVRADKITHAYLGRVIPGRGRIDYITIAQNSISVRTEGWGTEWYNWLDEIELEPK